jgi:hypothetical protein
VGVSRTSSCPTTCSTVTLAHLPPLSLAHSGRHVQEINFLKNRGHPLSVPNTLPSHSCCLSPCHPSETPSRDTRDFPQRRHALGVLWVSVGSRSRLAWVSQNTRRFPPFCAAMLSGVSPSYIHTYIDPYVHFF